MVLLIATVVFSLADSGAASGVHRALLQRDGFSSCDVLYRLGEEAEIRGALVRETEVVAPSWVPMRAATCLLERLDGDPTALELAQRWLADPEAPGFALLVVKQLDALPEDRAVELALLAVKRLSIDARFSRSARPLLAASQHLRVRALVEPVPNTP